MSRGMSLTGDVVVQERGQVPIRLRLDMNALCAFEAESGQAPLPWLASFEAGRVVSSLEARAMVWAMSQRHHPEFSLEAAGNLLDRHPDLITRVISAALPDAEAAEQRGKKPVAPSIWRRCFGRGSRRD